MKTVLAVLTVVFLVASPGAQVPVAVPQPPDAGVWRPFEGTWSATGQRHALPTAGGGQALTLHLSGSVAVTLGEGLGRGFRGEVIGFDDGEGLTVAHGVWTDERGDRIFSRLKGDTVASGRRIVGTITGGTGRYVGIAGEYAFDWQYVLSAEGDTISGRSMGLRGRFRPSGGPQ